MYGNTLGQKLMTELLLGNLVFFIIPVSGASTFAFLVYKFLRGQPPSPGSPSGGTKIHLRGPKYSQFEVDRGRPLPSREQS